MSDINLLRDKDSVQEKSKKKTGGVGIELTRPQKEKDDISKQIKRGGLSEFFGRIFKRKKKDRIISQKIVKKDEKLVMVDHDKAKKQTDIKVEDMFETQKEPEKNFTRKIESSISAPVAVEKSESKMPNRVMIDTQPDSGIPEKIEEKKTRKKFFTWASPDNGLDIKKDNKSSRKTNAKGAPEKNFTKVIPIEEKIQSLDVNLIPDDILGNFEPKAKLKQLGIAIGVILVVVGLSYGYMLYRESKIEGDIKKLVVEINGLDQEIVGLGDVRADAQTLKKQMDSVTHVMDNHVYWSQFLSYLEKYTLPNVYYKNLAATTEGKVTLSATAIDLATLADQYLILQNAPDFVEEVTIESAVSAITENGDSDNSNAVDFNISLQINPEIFFLNEEKPI
jgi:Tfp pilus assembly protein PilN